MRKLTLLLCLVLLIQLFPGCSSGKDEFITPVNFYYVNKEITYNSDKDVINSEVREGAQFRNTDDLLKAYLSGPLSDDMQNLIPLGTTLISFTTEDDSAYIQFSSHFSGLSGVRLISASAALLLTVHDYAGINQITISAENSQLDDKDELTLSMDDIVLFDAIAVDEQKE